LTKGFGDPEHRNIDRVVESISEFYRDLQHQVAELKAGCGVDSPEATQINRDIKNIKSSLFKKLGNGTMLSKSTEVIGGARRRKRSASKSKSKSKSKSRSRSRSKSTGGKKKRRRSKSKIMGEGPDSFGESGDSKHNELPQGSGRGKKLKINEVASLKKSSARSRKEEPQQGPPYTYVPLNEYKRRSSKTREK